MLNSKRACRDAMLAAEDYATWREAAAELDRLEGNDAWKAEDASEDYDWRLIQDRRQRIRALMKANDAPLLVYEMRQGLHWNLGNHGNPFLYAHAHVGTKQLIEDYVRTVAQALEFIRDADESVLCTAVKLDFFRNTMLSFGRSALMLSGGATLGLFHVGVVKALYREGLLPDVISGSSAGSVVAATVGTRTPEQMGELLDPESSYYYFWRPLRPRQMLARHVIMDQAQVREAIARNVHDMTFEEGQRLSGRNVNITVSPAARHQPPRLLNHLTYPHLLMRDAVLASCAVPFLFEPVTLFRRDRDGEREPYLPSLRWTDGSLKSDLPTIRLRRLYNVNHFIVSQTNPHVLPFLRRDMPAETGLVSALRNFGSASLRMQAQLLLELGGTSLPLRAARHGLRSVAAILDQEYRGNITVLPELSVWRYAHVTANPKPEAVRRFMLEGERATWPRIEMVRTQTLVARTLRDCLASLEHLEGRSTPGEGRQPPRLQVVRERTT